MKFHYLIPTKKLRSLFVLLAFFSISGSRAGADEFYIQEACSERYGSLSNYGNACISTSLAFEKQCKADRRKQVNNNGGIVNIEQSPENCLREGFNYFKAANPSDPNQQSAITGNGAAASESQAGSRSPGSEAPDLDQKLNDCREQTKVAVEFCTDPLKSMTNDEMSASPETMSAISGLSTMAMALVGGSKGAATYCKALEAGGIGLFGANGAFAIKCNSYINTCEKTCTEAIEKVGEDSSLRAELKRSKSKCESQKSNVVQYTSASVNSAMAAKMADACKQSAQMNYTPPPMPNITPPDCASAANANNPMCKTLSIGDYSTIGSGFSPATVEGKALSADDMNVGDMPDLQQAGVTGGAAGEASKNGGVPNGGGQMVGGGGSGKLGDGGGGGGGGRSPASLKSADVLQGERGGGGYVSPGAGFNSASGWSGYGQAGEGQGKGSGFDLSKYLPGQDKAPLRGPAGLGSARVELAPMYEDIFKKISDRFLIVCRTNRQKCN